MALFDNIMQDKWIILGAVGLIGGVFVLTRSGGKAEVQGITEGASNGMTSRTLYIPTESYNIQTYHGDYQANQTSNYADVINKAPTVETPTTTAPVVETPKTETTTTTPKAPVAETPKTTTTAPKTSTTYVVDSGQTLSGIAKEIGTTVGDITKLNPTITNANVVKAGTTIKTPPHRPTVKVTPIATKTHKVLKGDTVYALAKKYGTTIETIRKNNKLDSKYTIKIGQTLKV